MVDIHFGDRVLGAVEGETVLDALLRHGCDVPSSCRNGVCQSCMLRCEEGTPSPASQKPLKATLRARGYFLPCRCAPSEGMRISKPDGSLFVKARLVAREALAPRIARLLLLPESPLDYQGGQFVHLRRGDGLTRSYSLASIPGYDHLELHVAHLPGGRMSGWLHERFEVGEQIELRGPSGQCFYLPGRPEQPLLLVATGSGLAPLLAIVRSALAGGHGGPIHLYHGSTSSDGLYLVDAMGRLADEHDNLTYRPCVDEGDDPALRVGRAHDAALDDHRDLTGWRVFLCGHPRMVADMKKRAFIAGADLSDILSDPFEMSS